MMTDLEKMLELLHTLAEDGVIEGFDRCPGVDNIDIFLHDGTDFQIQIVP